jgi:hypothetical protein
MTASTLYESLEPQIVWKQLLTAILNELTGDGLRNEVRITPSDQFPILKFQLIQAIQLTRFILKTIHVQDEEIQAIHLPIVFSALCEALQVRMFFPTIRLV